MISEAKAIKIINKYLQCAQDANVRKHFPVVAAQIYSDDQLRELIADFLEDVYICSGMDENYADNACGLEIQDAIMFLYFYNSPEKRAN